MKILRIRLKNLNSLKGEHAVDLTIPPLSQAGLFAITGPTGAGKTTLLDAITLALYGRAARYGTESNPEHVMSRHCGECSAEVEFEVPAGVFRAAWSRRRAKGKADGKLQAPERAIYDALGTPLATQIRDADAKIEELLGLNYDRFLRSALLAQGDFAKFLKADAKERAELLESLTGTEIYSQLGQMAFEEAKTRDNELKIQEAALAQINILDPEARLDLEKQIQQVATDYENALREIQIGTEMLSKIQRLEEYLGKAEKAKKDLADITQKKSLFAPNLEQLGRHKLALEFSTPLAQFDAADKAKFDAEKSASAAAKKSVSARESVHLRNHRVRLAIRFCTEALERSQADAAEQVTRQQEIAKLAEEWLKENQADQSLAASIGPITAVISELKSARSALKKAWSGWRTGANEIFPEGSGSLPEKLSDPDSNEISMSVDGFLKSAEQRASELHAEFQDSEKKAHVATEALNHAKLVSSLEVHRHNLKTGESCPLCGALEHPFSGRGAPSLELKTLESALKSAKATLTRLSEKKVEWDAGLKNLKSRKTDLMRCVEEVSRALSDARDALHSFGSPPPACGGEDDLSKELAGRGNLFIKKTKDFAEAKDRVSKFQRQLDESKKESANLLVDLAKLPALPEGESFLEIDAEDLPDIPRAMEQFKVAMDDQTKAETEREISLKNANEASQSAEFKSSQLQEALATTEFKDILDLKSARMDSKAAEKIESLARELDKQLAAFSALLEEALSEIQTLHGQSILEGEKAVAFKQSHSELAAKRDTWLESKTTLQGVLSTDNANKERMVSEEAKLGDARKNLVVWKQLGELIGSHDGSKFRQIAQTISLDILTRHANKHLGKLSDRYRIQRETEGLLNLQIEDLHQAGAVRPMSSLSGGESFLASLALALGLSDLAGRTVRIDSLFIDEGFGSLDPDTLEVAIDALESLRQNQKTVGVISHVSLLKERIATQIIIEKEAGGRSRISLAG